VWTHPLKPEEMFEIEENLKREREKEKKNQKKKDKAEKKDKTKENNKEKEEEAAKKEKEKEKFREEIMKKINRNQGESEIRKKMVSQFLEWIFNYVLIPLLRSNFYITESGPYKKRIFYYNHQIWNGIKHQAFSNIQSNSQFTHQSLVTSH